MSLSSIPSTTIGTPNELGRAGLRATGRLAAAAKLANAAVTGAAVSDKFEAQRVCVRMVANGVQTAASRMQAGSEAAAQITQDLQRMQQLRGVPGEAAANEFRALQEKLRDTIGGDVATIGGPAGTAGAAFNGQPLFGIGRGTEQGGSDVSLDAANLRRGDVLALIRQDRAGAFELQADSAGTADTLAGAQRQAHDAQQAFGAARSQLAQTASRLQVEFQNLSSAVAAPGDGDAEAATRLAKSNLGSGPAAMRAQANQRPHGVLKALQQA